MDVAAKGELEARTSDAARVPALAGLAALVAALDLVLRRGVLRIIGDAFTHAARLGFEPYARALMNVVALATTIATFDAMAAMLRRPEAASLARRLSMAALMVTFLPCTGIAIFLPLEHTTFLLVMLSSMLAHIFAAQLSLGAFEHRADVFTRLANVAILGTSVGAVVSLVLAVVGPSLGWVWSYEVSGGARATGEIAWSLAPLLALIALVRRDPRGARSPRLAVAAIVLFLGTLTFLRARAYVGSEYPAVLYGALHVQTLADGPAIVYALVFGLGLAAGVHGALSRDGVDRQLGHASVMLLCAGFAPRAPIQLTLLVAAATLFARALYAQSVEQAEA